MSFDGNAVNPYEPHLARMFKLERSRVIIINDFLIFLIMANPLYVMVYSNREKVHL